MANFNYLNNAVGGKGATSHNTYYNTNPTNFGEYGYIYLTEIVDNFVATYTGTGKILANVLKADINFHAHRALQELSYDTLRSVKSQEIEVCPSLKMPLPHDYVNHVKLTSIDSTGIEHIIYPIRHTSNPFAISQSDGCTYDMESGSIKHQQSCGDSVSKDCFSTEMNDWIIAFTGTAATQVQAGLDPLSGVPAQPLSFPYTVNLLNYDEKTFYSVEEIYMYIASLVDAYCECVNSISTSYSCGDSTPWIYAGQDFVNVPEALSWWNAGVPIGGGWTAGPWVFPYGNTDAFVPGLINDVGPILFTNIVDAPNTGFSSGAAAVKYVNKSENWLLSDLNGTTIPECTLFSNTFDSYSSGSGTTTTVGASDALNPAIDNSHYFTNTGERYGLEPEHTQVNGSYFIDYLRGNIHFSSGLSGKTIILKYISDGHGTEKEQIVPKLAEEAMYKWIAYGCAQARNDVDQGTIARFKKEKFAETRKAKIRLSNIKIEEISQVFRGKSKWIKH